MTKKGLKRLQRNLWKILYSLPFVLRDYANVKKSCFFDR